jgi:hypothetical protein|tara:strand:- start:722 stop:1156 length:435 start_codon:yes stop_codon:yes gene_type:complete
MVKWNKENFIKTVKTNCFGHTTNVIVDLVNFSEDTADNLSWGKGENCGTMTYKCKSEDYGLIPLFNLTTNGKIKFHINYMRDKIGAAEIIKDYQLKLESNFMMDFDSELYPSDLSHKIEDLFNIKTEVDRFQDAISGISARLRQ